MSSSFNLSRAMTQLGIRSRTVLPQVDTSQIFPVIEFGSVTTFAPQVVEARGIVGSDPTVQSGAINNSLGLFLHCLAEGGLVVEQLWMGDPGDTPDHPQIHVADSFPSAAAGFAVRSALSMGGTALASVARLPAAFQAAALPVGDTQIGPDAPTIPQTLAFSDITSHSPELFGGLYVPFGGAVWVGVENSVGGNANRLRTVLRWREFPEPLGAP